MIRLPKLTANIKEQKFVSALSWVAKVSILSLVLTLAHLSGFRSSPSTNGRGLPDGLSALAIMGREGTPLKGVKFNKGDNFPLLYNMEKGKPVKLTGSQVTAWKNNVGSWAAAQGAPNFLAFAAFAGAISEDGSERTGYFGGQHPEWESLESWEGQREFIALTCETRFGQAIFNKTPAEARALPKKTVQEWLPASVK